MHSKLCPALVAAACGMSAFPLLAQQSAGGLTYGPNGFQASAGEITLEATALRDDVIQITEWRGSAKPEDSSWAVLPEARTARVPVIRTASGFRTRQLEITVTADLRLTVKDLQGHVLQQDASPIAYQGNSFHIAKQLAGDEHFFGLGDKVGPLDRRGKSFVDWNTDIGWQESTDPIYKSIPFFYAWRQGRVLGVLFDNTWRASFDFGKARDDEYSFSSVGGPARYTLMYGPGPKAVVEDYAWLTGKTPMPPLWAFGYQQSRFSYSPEPKVREVVDHLRADHIPVDAVYLDIDYQQKYRPFTVDPSKFPTFQKMIADLKARDVRVVAITDLHIAHAPGIGYQPYDQGTAENRFLKMPDGSQYVGNVWPGPSVFPEFTEADTRAWWGKLYSGFSHDGIAGFWNDMNEPSVFGAEDNARLMQAKHTLRGNEAEGFAERIATHPEIHNVMGLLNTRGTYDGLRALQPNERPFVLTRASYAGGQRYASTWTGDNSSTWNHLRLTTPMLENLGLSGFAMAGADVGGFLGSPQMDLLTKWFEIGAFQTIDRDHTVDTSRPQEPWVGGPQHEAIRKRFIETRYRLLPYIYTAAEEMHRTGVPLVRPLFLEFARPDGHPIDLDAPAEFLFGPSLLIAPPEFPDETDDYQVMLPAGDWYDFWTGSKVSNGKLDNDSNEIRLPKITPELASVPVYVRGGAVLAQQPLVQSTMLKPQGPLTLDVYPKAAAGDGDACSGAVYLDDGISYDFEKGAFLRMSVTCTGDANGAVRQIRISPHTGSYQPWWQQLRVVVHGLPASATPNATVNGGKLNVTHIASNDAWEMTVADDGKGATIQLQ